MMDRLRDTEHRGKVSQHGMHAPIPTFPRKRGKELMRG
jgi:hypothetical protein